MSYCLNPDCQKPYNPSDAKFCIRCGTKLLLGDRYRSLKLIGKGGSSRTFFAVDEGKPSKPQCVIKQFFSQAQGTNNPEEAARLFHEKAVRLENLGTHSQIPDLLAYFTQNQHQFLVQEFINGQNLAQDLESNGAFDENQIRQLLKDILPVLQFVHDRNVIHRDIKPKNIIRRTTSITNPSDPRGEGGTRGGQFVLVDFGAAKFASGSGLPAAATIIGTAGYVAPEQALGRGTYASDFYSLGITCIHLLTQLEPFELYSVADATWAWRENLNNPVTDELGQILDKMLEYATRRRYQSAAEIIDDLNLLDTTSKAHTVALSITTEQPSLELPSITTEQPSPELSSVTTEQPSLELSSVTTEQPSREVSPQVRVPTIVKVAPTPHTQNWQCVQTFVGNTDKRSDWYAGITSIVFSPDGQLLISGSEDSSIKVWELSTGNEIRLLAGHSNFVNSIAISPDGELLASVGGDIIKIWDVNTGQEIRTLTGHSALIHSVAFSPDGQMIASGANDSTIKLWNPHTGEEIRTLSATNLIEVVRFSPDGQFLVSGDHDNNIKLWDLNTGEEIRTLSGHSRKVRSVSFGADGQTLVSGSSDKTIKIWKLETGELVHTLTGHNGWFAGVNSVVFSPDGQTLASASDDKTIKLWNANTGEVITTLSGHSRGVSAVVFSPDGQTFASGSSDKTIKIWRCD
jgi:WD40 repeat protein